MIKHQAGSVNRVTDALSRHVCLLKDLHVSVIGFDTFKSLYANDSVFGPIYSRLQVARHEDFILKYGFLFKGVCLCVPACSFRLRIITELHGVGHVGRDRSVALVNR